jgi:soluble P-type ATPase
LGVGGERFEAVAGYGVRANLAPDDGAVWVGRSKLMTEIGLLLPDRLQSAAEALEDEDKTAVYAGWDGEVRGVLAAADTLKEGARQAIDRLRSLGLEVAMITGDNGRTAQAIAGALGIDRVLADVLPADEVSEISELQSRGHVVAMVGDGVNDAPVLVAADLGIAIGTGSDVAIESSDVTLMREDLDGVLLAIELSRRTHRTIVQNLVWAFGYNTAAIPLAVAGLLDPIVAGAAMAFFSVSVVASSLRLRGFASGVSRTVTSFTARDGLMPEPLLPGGAWRRRLRECPRSSRRPLSASRPVSRTLSESQSTQARRQPDRKGKVRAPAPKPVRVAPELHDDLQGVEREPDGSNEHERRSLQRGTGQAQGGKGDHDHGAKRVEGDPEAQHDLAGGRGER